MNERELPARMYLKNGRYYYVKRAAAPARNLVWTGLSRNLSEALEQHRLLESGKAVEAFEQYGAPSHWLGGAVKDLHKQAARRAKECDILFTLTIEDVVAIGMASNWRCAVTGLKFDRDHSEGHTQRPFMASIDRINSRLGYSKDNCRLVCAAANVAMNQWGQGVLHKLAIAYVQHHKLLGTVRTSNGLPKNTAVSARGLKLENSTDSMG